MAWPPAGKPSKFNENNIKCFKMVSNKLQAFAIKSRPDILIFQVESVGGHENARESREERNPGEKNGLQKCNIKKSEHVFKDGVDPGSFWGRSGVLWDHSRGHEMRFLMVYENFEVPECVGSQNSMKIAKVGKL
jgi:hypothetical protein